MTAFFPNLEVESIMPGPAQDDRKKDQVQSPSAGTMGGNSPPPPTDLSQESIGSGPKTREEYQKEIAEKQQSMSTEMNKGRGQSEQGQSQQQNQDNTQRR